MDISIKNQTSLLKILPYITGIIALLVLSLWVFRQPEIELTERVPGTDNVIGEEPEAKSGGDVFSGSLTVGNAAPANIAGSWPNFRGLDYDSINKESIKLDRSWAESEPKEIWGMDVGEGYAGAAILDGKVYLLDYDAEAQADVMLCLSLADGGEIWRYSYPVAIKRNHGMSRTVPAVTDKYLVSIGPMCHVLCLDPNTGEFLWAFDLVEQYGTVIPEWYAGQCPIIEQDKAIIAPGGEDVLMMAVDCATGDIIWKTPNPNAWNMTHSSIIPMDILGQRTYVYCASGGVVGVSAQDGSILWETTDWKISIATVPSPVQVGEDLIFLSGGYNSGSMMLKIKDENGNLVPETLFRLKPNVFGSDQQTPIFYKGYIYGVRPDKQMVCLDLNGSVVWKSGTANRFGIGPYMIADGMMYILDDSGLLTLAEARSDTYNQLAQSQVLHGHDAWGPMAMVKGRLILRDLTRMVCLDVAAK
ncbi:PQQ-binding-like beta-propeller repeat protein [Candidatus Poribacteria bacterium]|nr:PQQ-binding-like beta-propeller repeat protein [Candidatus Poribacteria bacterium]